MPPTDAIPSFRCRPGCSDCCGPHPWSAAEYARIKAFLSRHGLRERRATSLSCPYVGPRHRCLIYPVRPFICQLYGTVENLRCPHGCGPKRLLTQAEGHRLTQDYISREGIAVLVAPEVPKCNARA